MENIISILVPLVVILAILLPRLWRSKSAARAGSRAAEPKKPAGLLDTINRKLEKLAASERSQSARDPDDDEDDNPWSSGDEPETEAGPKKTTAKPTGAASRPEPAAAVVPPVDQKRAKPVTPRKAARVEVPAILPNPATGTRISREELRRAIVWSEILAPPLALRKPEP